MPAVFHPLTALLLCALVQAQPCAAQASLPLPAPPATPLLAAAPAWEGALGVSARVAPAYLGATGAALKLHPGLFLRYGRWSLTTAGGFVTQRDDQVERGLATELLRRGDLLVKLSLRLDGGRDTDVDPALNGLDKVRRTLRGRLSVQAPLAPGWQASAALAPDLLGRGGGLLVNAGLSRQWRLSPDLRWGVAANVNAADARYMQSYFGVTPAEGVRSGKPAYAPSAGLRDLGLGVGFRQDLGPHWFAFGDIAEEEALQSARLFARDVIPNFV